MSKEAFIVLNKAFKTNKTAFDLALTKLTAAELDQYLDSQKDDNTCNYLAKQHPRFLAQALWSATLRSNNSGNPLQSQVLSQIPVGFNPHQILR